MIRLFRLYKTDMGFYIPLKSLENDWFDGIINQYNNSKLNGWHEFKLTRDKIEYAILADEYETIAMLFEFS